MDANTTNGNSRIQKHLRKYPVRLLGIPKLQNNDPKVDELIACNEPVIITGTELTSSAKEWNLEYLETRLKDTACTIVVSKNHNFKYHDEKKFPENFKPSVKRTQMPFTEFVKQIKDWKRGNERLYLQQPVDNSIGLALVQDFLQFNWKWASEKQVKHGWGPLTSNLLMVSMEGNVSPCHYDQQHNFFAQIKGIKRFILFSPSQFECLYPHPVTHPCDRQSQIDFDKPDYGRFPKFKDISGFEAILEPGDVLFIPMYWFHHVESLRNLGYTISVNFWYKVSPIADVTYPLKDYHKISIMRNVEKMLADTLKDPREIGPLLQAMLNGRYT